MRLVRPDVHQHWQRGAFTASELTMKSRKKGVGLSLKPRAVGWLEGLWIQIGGAKIKITYA